VPGEAPGFLFRDMNTPSQHPPRPRKTSLGAKFALAIGLTAVLTWFITYVVVTPCNGVKQAINMREADHYIAQHRSILLNAPGREKVEIHTYTGGDCGSIMIRGTLQSPEEAEPLRDDVVQTAPPVQVLFFLEYFDGEAMVPLEVAPIQTSP
jgi:hypothetical protein